MELDRVYCACDEPTNEGPANSSSIPCSENASSRPKILLLAYAISPIRGSEYAVGWNHVTHLAEYCDLTVLYGSAGPHMGDLEEIEDYLRQYGEMAHVQFVPIRPNILARLLNAPNRAGVLVYSFYLAYRVWHWQAAGAARNIIANEPIDLIHYLCPIGYREPGYLWQLGKPYVWGPVGGLNMALRLAGAPRPWLSRLKVMGKNFLNRLNMATSLRLRRALSSAHFIVAATTENQNVLRHKFGRNSEHIPENAIPDKQINRSIPDPYQNVTQRKFIWIGRLDWRKSPDLLLDAFSAVASRDWNLDIVGSGPLLAMATARAGELGLADRVNFHGHVARAEVHKLLVEADLHIITSMSEANTTVIWEAMSAGVPTLTLDHCGMHDVVCDKCGVRVPPTDYAGTRNRIAAEIEGLITDPEKLALLADGVASCREQYLWSKRSRQWLEIYRATIARVRS